MGHLSHHARSSPVNRLFQKARPECLIISQDGYECGNESSARVSPPLAMASITHAVFIDESGNGSPGFNVQRLWITAAVAVPLEMKEEMDEGIARVVASHFRPWMKELKGSDLPRGLRIGSSIEEVALEVADMMRRGGNTMAGSGTPRSGRGPVCGGSSASKGGLFCFVLLIEFRTPTMDSPVGVCVEGHIASRMQAHGEAFKEAFTAKKQRHDEVPYGDVHHQSIE